MSVQRNSSRRRHLPALATFALALGAGLAVTASAAPPPTNLDSPITWTNQIGTSGNETGGLGPFLARNSSGDIFVAFTTDGDIGTGSAGSYDAVLVKYDKNGVLKWSRQFGSAGGEIVYGVSVSSAGDAYVTGYTDGDFDGAGPGPFGDGDAFLAKYDRNGTQKWVRQVGTAGYDEARGVVAASSSDIYLVGMTTGDADGAGPGSHLGGFDVMLARYDRNGTQKWIENLGTAADDVGTAIAARGSTQIYVVGYTGGDIEAPGSMLGGNDGFVMRLDKNGAVTWTRQLGSSGTDIAEAIAVTGSNDVWISGGTDGSMDGADPGPYGSWDSFARRYDRNGSLMWTNQFGVAGQYTDSRGIAATSNGSTVFMVGYTDGDLDGAGNGFEPVDTSNLYLLRLSGATGFVSSWRQFGTTAWEGYPHVIVNSSGRPVVVGITQGVLPGHVNAGDADVFITQFP